jgi:GNAT superfamily N-acetyltransferase
MSEALQVVVAAPNTDPGRVAAPIVTSFSNDPFVRWLLPESDKYLRHFGGIARSHAAIALANGGARVTHDFKASAIWFLPGVEASAEAGEAFVAGIPEQRRETALAIFARMGASHPAEPCWHLRMLGADPPVQGIGYGSALLAATLRELDELGLAGYLESTSPASRRLYGRHGFEVAGEIQTGDSPAIWPMVRRARSH